MKNTEKISINALAFSFERGGAGKAAMRLSALAKKIGNVEIFSVEESPDTWYKKIHFMQRIFSYGLTFSYQKRTGVKCSANIFSFRAVIKSFLKSKGLHHIHWINNDTISIFDLHKIPEFSIVTLHDEWLYCGIEHYFSVKNDFKKSPYSLGSAAIFHQFPSRLHKFVWAKKRKAFAGRYDLVVTCPSVWLAERAKASAVLKHCHVRVLYNPIDVDVFSPLSERELSKKREKFNIDDRWLILFGAVGGRKNKLKGFEELESALRILAKNESIQNRLVIGLFGRREEGIKELHGFPVLELGYISDERKMAEVYSLAHATVVPSKLESFGQVAAESLSCESPVIAFRTSGLKDVVLDGKTGFLAEPFSVESLAEKIEAMINLEPHRYERLCKTARKHVIEKFSSQVVSEEYKKIINGQWIKKKESST